MADEIGDPLVHLIRNAVDHGVEVIIRLPLTLAIINGLQVSVGDEIFIIPLGSVVEALKVESTGIEMLQGRKVMNAQNEPFTIESNQM